MQTPKAALLLQAAIFPEFCRKRRAGREPGRARMCKSHLLSEPGNYQNTNVKIIRERPRCSCGEINLVLVAALAGGIIHDPPTSPPSPPSLRSRTLSQERAFILLSEDPGQTRLEL